MLVSVSPLVSVCLEGGSFVVLCACFLLMHSCACSRVWLSRNTVSVGTCCCWCVVLFPSKYGVRRGFLFFSVVFLSISLYFSLYLSISLSLFFYLCGTTHKQGTSAPGTIEFVKSCSLVWLCLLVPFSRCHFPFLSVFPLLFLSWELHSTVFPCSYCFQSLFFALCC